MCFIFYFVFSFLFCLLQMFVIHWNYLIEKKCLMFLVLYDNVSICSSASGNSQKHMFWGVPQKLCKIYRKISAATGVSFLINCKLEPCSFLSIERSCSLALGVPVNIYYEMFKNTIFREKPQGDCAHISI